MNFGIEKIRSLGARSFLVWFRYSRIFFTVLFFLSIGAGVLTWYDNVYRGDWTDEEKRAYAESTFKETVLHEEEFRKAVEASERRAARHGQAVEIGNDFFAPIPGVEKKR